MQWPIIFTVIEPIKSGKKLKTRTICVVVLSEQLALLSKEVVDYPILEEREENKETSQKFYLWLITGRLVLK